MIELDINKPLSVENCKLLRAQLMTNAFKSIRKSLPVLLTCALFFMFERIQVQSIDDWLQSSSSSFQVINNLIFIILNLSAFFGLIISANVFWVATKSLSEMDVSKSELNPLQKQVHNSGDKVCAKYLVNVYDMGRDLLTCEKEIILQRITVLQKENEINKLRDLL